MSVQPINKICKALKLLIFFAQTFNHFTSPHKFFPNHRPAIEVFHKYGDLPWPLATLTKDIQPSEKEKVVQRISEAIRTSEKKSITAHKFSKNITTNKLLPRESSLDSLAYICKTISKWPQCRLQSLHNRLHHRVINSLNRCQNQPKLGRSIKSALLRNSSQISHFMNGHMSVDYSVTIVPGLILGLLV